MSPVLAGGFLSTVPPGSLYILNMYDLLYVIFAHKTGGGGPLFVGDFQLHCTALAEKAMAPHSSTLAWKIPWTEEPGRLQSMGLLRVRHD